MRDSQQRRTTKGNSEETDQQWKLSLPHTPTPLQTSAATFATKRIKTTKRHCENHNKTLEKHTNKNTNSHKPFVASAQCPTSVKIDKRPTSVKTVPKCPTSVNHVPGRPSVGAHSAAHCFASVSGVSQCCAGLCVVNGSGTGVSAASHSRGADSESGAETAVGGDGRRAAGQGAQTPLALH